MFRFLGYVSEERSEENQHAHRCADSERGQIGETDMPPRSAKDTHLAERHQPDDHEVGQRGDDHSRFRLRDLKIEAQAEGGDVRRYAEPHMHGDRHRTAKSVCATECARGGGD